MRRLGLPGIALLVACRGGSLAPAPAPPGPSPASTALVLIFGSNVAAAVQARVTGLVTAASPLPVVMGDPSKVPSGLSASSYVLSFGDTAATRAIIFSSELSALGPEGFIVRSGAAGAAGMLAADGNPARTSVGPPGSLGTSYGTYALLEQLGFAFLHPLAPTLPAQLRFPTQPVNQVEKPYWPIRGTHLHTMHPLELTELLQGWGPAGTDDAAGWVAMLPEWQRFVEWAIANRQNRVEWVFLWAQDWAAFADGPVRQQRYQQLVTLAHAYGLTVGADAPIALQQQHTYALIRSFTDLPTELADIHTHLDWIFGGGFDYISTESGTTEFTHPDPTSMLAWMNEVAQYSHDHWGKEANIKAHCSTGQTAPGYPDPVTGQPINFNFLPHYASPLLGVMPHTVEHYGIDDPAPTYGNANFGYMRDFLEQEAGSREVLWHPETAYWISFDINVPLFLPLYAERRLSDLRSLAKDELAGKMGRGSAAGARMDGQVVFSSGWEWGYWLNDVIAARAAWNPRLDIADDREAFLAALAPVANTLGGAGPAAAQWIASVAWAQRALLIQGQVAGVAPSSVVQRNGQAYLQGFDAMDDLSDWAVALGLSGATVQPDRLGLVDMRVPLGTGPNYPSQVVPLLAQMDGTFGELGAQADALTPAAAGTDGKDLWDDLADGARVLALRARQVHGLYDFVNGWPALSPGQRASLATARRALDTAQALVAAREPRYRVPAARVASWRPNPTAYPFTYLWAAHSLYFWWRDEGKAVDAPLSPCYLNIENPVDVGLGEGVLANIAAYIAAAAPNALTECLAAPTQEPSFPQDNIRSRP